jgi:hypothetical protein
MTPAMAPATADVREFAETLIMSMVASKRQKCFCFSTVIPYRHV